MFLFECDIAGTLSPAAQCIVLRKLTPDGKEPGRGWMLPAVSLQFALQLLKFDGYVVSSKSPATFYHTSSSVRDGHMLPSNVNTGWLYSVWRLRTMIGTDIPITHAAFTIHAPNLDHNLLRSMVTSATAKKGSKDRQSLAGRCADISR